MHITMYKHSEMGFGLFLRHVSGKNCEQDTQKVMEIDGSIGGDSTLLVLEAFVCLMISIYDALTCYLTMNSWLLCNFVTLCACVLVW